MESSRQTTTKIARPEATIIKYTPLLPVDKQLRGRLDPFYFSRKFPRQGAEHWTELPQRCVRRGAGVSEVQQMCAYQRG